VREHERIAVPFEMEVPRSLGGIQQPAQVGHAGCLHRFPVYKEMDSNPPFEHANRSTIAWPQTGENR
jgi:hypothetical protein